MNKSSLREVSAYLELPSDGTLRAIRIYVKSEDGQDLTEQAVLDAVSDVLIDSYPLADEGHEEPYYDA